MLSKLKHPFDPMSAWAVNRWTVTFLDLAANVPKLSIEAATASTPLAMVDGGVGVVSFGVETVQEASALCCIGGDFSLAFDGIDALDIDLESIPDMTSAVYVAEGLGSAIDQGTRSETTSPYVSHNGAHCSGIRTIHPHEPPLSALCHFHRPGNVPRHENLHPLSSNRFCIDQQPDIWGSITVSHKTLLDGGNIWSVTFNEYSLVAGAGGAPLLAVSRDDTTIGTVTIARVAGAASPTVHRVLVAALSTLEPTGMFKLSLEGVVTRAISVDASADDMQNVRYCLNMTVRRNKNCPLVNYRILPAATKVRRSEPC